jgi:hypothetical protein
MNKKENTKIESTWAYSPVEWLTDQLPVRIQNMYSEEIAKAIRMEKCRWLELYAQGHTDREDNIFKNPIEQQTNGTIQSIRDQG